jgi:hypothetical protein
MTIPRSLLIGLLALTLVACDITITAPTITNTLTNEVRVTNDSHDVANFNPTTPTPPTNPTTPGVDNTLPLPVDAQAIATAVANSAAGQLYLAHSCQDRDGVNAWQFMDAIVTALKAKDTRWGYLCKNGNCQDISKDVIAYRATNDNTGVWGVDIIGSHCAIPPDRSTFTWNVLGFDPLAIWKETRQ